MIIFLSTQTTFTLMENVTLVNTLVTFFQNQKVAFVFSY